MNYYSESGLELKYGTPSSAGLDLPFYDPELEEVTIHPKQRTMLKTGIYCEIPEGYFGLLDNRSSTSKLVIDLLCRTIDSDYRGNIRVVYVNNGENPVVVRRGEKLAQMILIPVFQPNLNKLIDLSELNTNTIRSDNGFGHTGGSQAAQGV